MKFTAEEAKAITIEYISKQLGNAKMNLIIEDIRNTAKEGLFYANLDCSKYDIDNKFIYFVGIWAEFNGYKVSYPRAGVVTVDWRNV